MRVTLCYVCDIGSVVFFHPRLNSLSGRMATSEEGSPRVACSQPLPFSSGRGPHTISTLDRGPGWGPSPCFFSLLLVACPGGIYFSFSSSVRFPCPHCPSHLDCTCHNVCVQILSSSSSGAGAVTPSQSPWPRCEEGTNLSKVSPAFTECLRDQWAQCPTTWAPQVALWLHGEVAPAGFGNMFSRPILLPLNTFGAQ